MKINVIIAGTGPGGPPAFVAFAVTCTQEQYDEGDHYEHAKENATIRGLLEFALEPGPMIAFDENDGPDWLFSHLEDGDIPSAILDIIKVKD